MGEERELLLPLAIPPLPNQKEEVEVGIGHSGVGSLRPSWVGGWVGGGAPPPLRPPPPPTSHLSWPVVQRGERKEKAAAVVVDDDEEEVGVSFVVSFSSENTRRDLSG